MTDCCVIALDKDTGKLKCFIRDADLNRWLDRRKERVTFT